MAGCAKRRTGSPMRWPRTASARRPGRDPAAAGAGGRGRPYRDLQARRRRVAAGDAVRRRCAGLPAAGFRRGSADHQRRRGWPRSPASASQLPALNAVICRSTAPDDGALGFEEMLARASSDFTAVATSRRRSGADDLHLRHHRPAEGRAARPPRAARSSARHRTAARVPAAARRPVLDAGRLGLGRRAAQRAAAEPVLRRAGGGAPVRQVRSGGGVRADGAARRAQRLHPADGAADAALGAEPARAPRAAVCARSAPAARRSAPKPSNGAAPRSASPSTSSTARPNAIWCSASCAAIGVCAAGRDRQAGAGPRGRGHPRRRLGLRARRAGPDRGPAARPGDVPRILGPAGGDARRSSSATG